MVGHQPTHLSAFNHLRLGRYADLYIILSQSDSQPDLKGFLQKDCVLETSGSEIKILALGDLISW